MTTTRSHWPARTKACGTTRFLETAVHRLVTPWCVQRYSTAIDPSQADSIFSGISTFGRLPYYPCLKSKVDFDIAFIGTDIRTEPRSTQSLTLSGAPFDTGTSYRPGARFGPSGIRQGSRRLNL